MTAPQGCSAAPQKQFLDFPKQTAHLQVSFPLPAAA
jgi:hypothetical protein